MSYDPQSKYPGFNMYESVKLVKAAKITHLEPFRFGQTKYSMRVNGAETGPHILVPADLHPVPEVGWYVVMYPNGYISFSPPKAFEEGHICMDWLTEDAVAHEHPEHDDHKASDDGMPVPEKIK
jgi:hypothetical protein